MRIYYCGWIEATPLEQLAAAGDDKSIKRCGATALYRCRCGGRHPDRPDGWSSPPPLEDHPEFLCKEHFDLLKAKRKFDAEARVRGKQTHIGRVEAEEAAARARALRREPRHRD
jgi:hypothetical protein